MGLGYGVLLFLLLRGRVDGFSNFERIPSDDKFVWDIRHGQSPTLLEGEMSLIFDSCDECHSKNAN